MVSDIWLNKSKINLFLQCPYKYKLRYIDKLEEPKSEAMIAGGEAHEAIEKFYKEGVEWSGKDYIFKYAPPKLKKFLEFERRRAEKCKTLSDPKKFFMPVFIEHKIKNNAFKLNGIVDAVFYNYDGEYIVIDWKTGKYRPYKKTDYRRELAIYKILLDHSGLLDKPVKYIGMFFTDADHLFFEECKAISVKRAYEMIERVRNKIQNKEFKCKLSPLCRYCGFAKSCQMEA